MLKRKTLPIAVSLLIGSAFANAATIENAGFESGMESWTEVDPAAISNDEYSGSSSLKISGSPARVHQWVDLELNTDYILSAYVKGAGQIGVNNTAGIFVKKQFDVSDWTKVSVAFNSGSKDSTQVFAKYTSSTSQVRFDDFELVQSGSSPTPTPSPSSTPSTDCSVSQIEVSASDDGTNDGHGPALAIDGSTASDSRWSSKGEGKWLQLDLGGETSLESVNTAWYKADTRTSYFDIQTSTNGSNWTTVISGAQSQGDSDLHSNDLGDVYARYIRILGNGNSSSAWNSLLEAEVIGCQEFSVSPTPTPTPTPTDTSPTPSSGSSIPSLITDGSLWDLEGDDPSPLVNSSTLKFVPLETKVTTPNGNGWRHEYKIKSSERVAMTETYENFKATIKVDMSTGGKTIVAQHHAGDTGTIMKLYVADSSESGFIDSKAANGIFDVYVRILNTSGVEEKKPLGTIKSGDSFSFQVVNNYGVVKVSAFGEELETEVEDDSESYLKFGNYLQSQYPNGSIDCGEHGDSDSFAACFKDIGITESTVTMTDVSYERIVGGDTGNGSSTPSTGGSVSIPSTGDADYPSDLMRNYDQWKITYPDGAEEKKLYQQDNEYFYVNDSGNGIVFYAPVRSSNGTTPNSSYIRSELRERTADGSADIYWETDGKHVAYAKQAITHLPIVKSHLVATQIHGNKAEGIDDALVLRLEDSHLFLSFNGGQLRENVTVKTNYQLGTVHEVIFEVIDGKHFVYYSEDGKLSSAYASGTADQYLVKDGSNDYVMDLSYGESYFKIGNYTQSNAEKEGDSTDDPDNYGEVVVYDFWVDHSDD